MRRQFAVVTLSDRSAIEAISDPAVDSVSKRCNHFERVYVGKKQQLPGATRGKKTAKAANRVHVPPVRKGSKTRKQSPKQPPTRKRKQSPGGAKGKIGGKFRSNPLPLPVTIPSAQLSKQPPLTQIMKKRLARRLLQYSLLKRIPHVIMQSQRYWDALQCGWDFCSPKLSVNRWGARVDPARGVAWLWWKRLHWINRQGLMTLRVTRDTGVMKKPPARGVNDTGEVDNVGWRELYEKYGGTFGNTPPGCAVQCAPVVE